MAGMMAAWNAPGHLTAVMLSKYPGGRGCFFSSMSHEMRGEKSFCSFCNSEIGWIHYYYSPLSPHMVLVQQRVGWWDRGVWTWNTVQLHICHIFYYFPSSPLSPVREVLHFSHDWFSYHVGPLSWPRSDLKAIKHKTFCKTRMLLWLWRPCNASPGNYDNNSVAVGVARSLVWGWGQWDWVHQGSLSRDRSRWLVGPRHPLPLCHKLFPSCRMQSAARYAAEPLCLVATGDKARADGRVVLLAPQQWWGQSRSLSWPAEENAWVNITPMFVLWGSLLLLNFLLLLFLLRGRHKAARELCPVGTFGVWICCWVEGGAGCSPTTPPECVNEKERGQEESAGSTTEVLTEGIEGLRLHLFRPSTLPAGPRQSLSLLLASVMGARASPTSSAHSASSLLVGERRAMLEAPSAEGSLWSLRPAWGRGLLGLHDSATGVSQR